MQLRGKVSWFGGPDDTGVSPSEGLAFIYSVDDAPHLFLEIQPPDTTGLARRLDPEQMYIACRWDYDVHPKPSLLENMAMVRSPKTGRFTLAYPADWGPHVDTDRVADISPGLMAALGIDTDDEVEVIYPYEEQDEKPMPYEAIVISSGHGKYVRGAHGIIDEVDEARKVVEALANQLKMRGVDVTVFHDDVSKSQSENLDRIVDFHNDQGPHSLDISVHFNAFEQTSAPRGVEVLYVTQSQLAGEISAAIADAGDLIDRGGKYHGGLAFLNGTVAPSVLLEVCFVDSEEDCHCYDENFDDIVDAIANVLGGTASEGSGEGEELPPPITTTPVPPPRIDIEVSGEVIIYINGQRVVTKGD
jgi:N-acetylmuramoyl-L-alanine amidase